MRIAGRVSPGKQIFSDCRTLIFETDDMTLLPALQGFYAGRLVTREDAWPAVVSFSGKPGNAADVLLNSSAALADCQPSALEIYAEILPSDCPMFSELTEKECREYLALALQQTENYPRELTFHTSHSDETQALAQALANSLHPGDLIVLQGDLGAGKSVFARGIARGLGIACPIPSPTFTILNVYEEGRVPFYHFDWYRIEDPEELDVMGAGDYIRGNGVTAVEWAERAPEKLGDQFLLVNIEKQSDERLIGLHCAGLFRSLNRQMLPEALKC